MEPTKTKMRIYLGEFEVVEVKSFGGIRIMLGPGTTITIHVGDFPHQVKLGDKLPLYTEMPYAQAVATPIQ